jgi:hypothetical protein
MRDFMRRARPWAAVLFVSTFLVACDDDDPADLGFDAETANEFTDAANEVLTPLISEDANVTIGNAMLKLDDIGGASIPMVPFEVGARLSAEGLLGRERPARLAAAAMSGTAAPQGPVIPDSLFGTTYVWDFDSLGYVASDLSGAPTDGIRFLYYAIDPVSGEPAEPLNALGHLDIVDASTTSAARMELELIQDDDDVTLADYFVQAAITSNTETTTATVTADGFIRGEGERADFDMTMVFSTSDATHSEAVDVVIENQASNAALRLDYEYDETGDQTSEVAAFTIEDGSDEAVFQYEAESDGDQSVIDGELLFNGDEVVLFSAEGDQEIEYTRPDGSALTSSEIEALAGMWFGYFFTVIFTYGILLPFLALVSAF